MTGQQALELQRRYLDLFSRALIIISKHKEDAEELPADFLDKLADVSASAIKFDRAMLVKLESYTSQEQDELLMIQAQLNAVLDDLSNEIEDGLPG